MRYVPRSPGDFKKLNVRDSGPDWVLLAMLIGVVLCAVGFVFLIGGF